MAQHRKNMFHFTNFKIVLAIILLFSVFFIIKPILAQDSTDEADDEGVETTITPTPGVGSTAAVTEANNKINATKKPNNLESWKYEGWGADLAVANTTVLGDNAAQIFDAGTTGTTTWVPGGLLGAANKFTAYLFVPPASGIEYIASSVGNFIGKPALAQGYGFKGLQPLIPIWRSFRNVVYLLFSIIFVIIGLMIMLRIKISPQAVVTLQNSIPKIITSLLLVTFSYAIAGLLLDFSYVIRDLGLNLLGPNLPPSLAPGYNADIFWGRSFEMTLAPLAVMGGLTGGIAAGLIGATAGFGAGAIALLVVLFIFSLIIVISVFKFTFALVKCYLTIILHILLAPFEIMIGAFPNSKAGFSSWFINLIANIVVFPVSFFFLIIGYTIWYLIGQTSINQSALWVPEIIGFTGQLWIIQILVGFGVVLMLPKIPNLVIEAIFKLKSPFGAAVGEAVKGMPMRNLGASVVDVGVQKGTTGIWNKMTSKLKTGAGGKSP